LRIVRDEFSKYVAPTALQRRYRMYLVVVSAFYERIHYDAISFSIHHPPEYFHVFDGLDDGVLLTRRKVGAVICNPAEVVGGTRQGHQGIRCRR
jgi:hypothetical protein